MIRKLILKLFVLWFIGYSSQAIVRSNIGPKKNRHDTESKCREGLKCMPISNCDTTIPIEITFPCKNENGSEYVCCYDTDTTKTMAPVSMTTTITVKTTMTTPKLTYKWSVIPKSLRAKTKLLPDECGIPSILKDKIANGNVTELGEFPWMVWLGYKINNKTHFNCGGSLINDRYVLTAAHCLKVLLKPGQEVEINIARFGEWDITTEIDCVEDNDGTQPFCGEKILDRGIERKIAHPLYGNKDSPSFQNDIALLRMEKEVPFTLYITPICLEPTILDAIGGIYFVTGWGVSNIKDRQASSVLKIAPIKHFDFDECNVVSPPEFRPLSETQFCAAGDSLNSCYGDSGGPLAYVSRSGHYTLKGIVSLTTAEDCGESGSPNIYTEVASYILWILEAIQI